jgi:stage II sporulation protein E
MDIGGQGRLALTGSGALEKAADKRFMLTARCVIYMLLGLVLSCARVLESGAPLGMAMVACSGPGVSGVFALTGAAIGYLVSGGIEWGIRYIAAAVLVYTIAFVFHELEAYKNPYFMPSASALVMGFTGFLGSFTDIAGQVPLAAQLFLEIALAFGGTYFFREALSSHPCNTETAELRHNVSSVIMAACLLMAISRLEVFGTVSIGRVLALVLVMCSAIKGGMLTGAAVGTVLGLAMDIAADGSPFYTMAYSFSGLLSGVFSKHGRVIFTLSFILAGALSVVCAWTNQVYISALFETFCASVFFMVLPGSVLLHLGLMLQYNEPINGEIGLRRFVASRVKNLGDAYSELFDTVRRNIQEPYNDENIARIYDRAADEVCVQCKHKNRCWNAEYVDTLSAMNDATQAMVEHGCLETKDLPLFFQDKCENLPAFVAAVNGELRGLSYRRQLRAFLSENRSVAWGQYLDVADILSSIAKELGNPVGAEPLTERRLLRYLRGLDMDADAAVYRDGSGRLRISIECARLGSLVKDEDYLEKLSQVVGVRLCQSGELSEDSSSLTLLEAEPLAVSIGIAALKKRGERVSGDKGTYFKTDSGVLCVILSDGMGCGDDAAKDSAQVVAILEKFLRSGVDPAVAMKILNSVLLLRGGDSWGYATVDLMCVDLFSGQTCFYKYGAAPSYVKSGRNIKRIKCETLAAGLSTGDGIAPDIVRMRMKPGSTAIIATDGVIADSEDGWLKELLLQGFDDMKALARATLKESEKLYGANDDMTVVTLRVEERL